MTTKSNETAVPEEIDILSGEGDKLELPVIGVTVKVEKLKTRQLFKFLKILTVGAGPALADLRLSGDTSQEELAQDLMALLLISVPDAEDEVIDFLKSMVSPLGLVEPERGKADRDKNVKLYTELFSQLNNPELGDTLALLTHIVKAETPNLMALGKQVAALLPSAAKLTTSTKKPSKKQTPADS